MSSRPPAPREVGPGRYRCDVAIVGAGIAGLYAALHLPDGTDVVVLDKGVAGRSGSSPWAQGGMAVALGPDDSAAAHARDTIVAGDGLCDPAAVEVLTTEAPDAVDDLLRLGARFDVREGASPTGRGGLHLAREGAQSHARSVHAADATGAEMVRALRRAAGPRVQRLEANAMALATHDTVVTGVHALERGRVVTLEARCVLLATGGCGGLYAATTNRDHATGDGVALALRAGAAVRDMAFVQFHPTGLRTSGAWRFLLTEALRGAGATLHDAAGERFMLDVHPDAELAPRHVVARAILDQQDGAWLDARHLGVARLEQEFPTVLAGAREHGFDLAAERVPVTPAAHYMVGGVRTDLWARTSAPGLWAAGEVASTGVHGANRMAGNSLVEALVFGRRAARSMAGHVAAPHRPVDPAPPLVGADAAVAATTELRDELRRSMWRHAGPSRSATGLRTVLGRLDRLDVALGAPSSDDDALELSAAVVVARAIAAEALVRDETRGGHVRRDAPSRAPAWTGVHVERTAPVAPGLGDAA